MKYEKPEIEIIYFEAEDVIKTSIKPVNPLPIDEGASLSSMFNLF